MVIAKPIFTSPEEHFATKKLIFGKNNLGIFSAIERTIFEVWAKIFGRIVKTVFYVSGGTS